jgi:hypothetical protein
LFFVAQVVATPLVATSSRLKTRDLRLVSRLAHFFLSRANGARSILQAGKRRRHSPCISPTRENTMKLRFYVCTCALLLLAFAGAGLADQTTDQYSMWMKPGAAANAALQKALGAGDLKAAAASAGDVQSNFAKIEAFWTMRGASDAVGFAQAVEADAKDAETAANAGDMAAAQAAAKKIGANCGMCHMAHRAKADDGTFMVK